MPAASKSPIPSAPMRATPMHLPKSAPAVVAVVFLISLVMNVAEGGKMARAADGESESLRQVLTNGRPGNLFTLTVNNADLCQSLLETFNKPFPKPEQFSSKYSPYFSDLLLKSSLSIEWEIIHNTSVLSLLIGRADINNDGQMDWLAEQVGWANIWPGYIEELFWFIPPQFSDSQ